MAWLTDWTYRKKITTQHANVDALLSDFPLYVGFSNDADLASALATGYDIRFTQSDGETLLKYERESWSGGGGSNVTADFWVKVPSISAVAGTDIYVYWGKAGAADGQDAANVWDANFQAVWHLNSLNDSSGNGKTLTAYNTPSSGQTGKIGDCYLFDDAQSEYLERYPDSIVTAYPFTMTALAKIDDVSHDGSTLLAFFQNKSSTDYARMLIYAEKLYAQRNGSLTTRNIISAVSVTQGAWTYFAFRGSASDDAAAWLNDNKYTDSGDAGAFSGINTYDVGRSYGSLPHYCSGNVDEVRLSSTARSDAWIKFEYHNIFEADHELTWGSVEEAPSGGVSGPYRTSAGHLVHTGAAAGGLFIPAAGAGRLFHATAAAGEVR